MQRKRPITFNSATFHIMRFFLFRPVNRFIFNRFLCKMCQEISIKISCFHVNLSLTD